MSNFGGISITTCALITKLTITISSDPFNKKQSCNIEENI